MAKVDEWVDTVLVAQCKYMLGAFDESNPLRDKVAGIFEGLRNRRCSICHQLGHAGPQCWFNGALYEECRSTGNLEVNYVFRAWVKHARQQEVLAAKYDFEVKASQEAAQKKASLQSTLAAKRARHR